MSVAARPRSASSAAVLPKARASPVRVDASGLRRPRAWPTRWTVAAAVTAVLLALPVLVIAAGVLTPPSATWSHIADTVLSDYVVNTLLLLTGGVALALGIGVATAWLVTAFEFPGRRFFSWALILPLAVPAYIAAYTYAGMLDVTGPIQRLLRAALPAVAPDFVYLPVMHIGTVLLIFGFVLYPYVYLVTRASFARQSGTLLEAARTLGRGPSGVFVRIALPLARPALAAGGGLVAMEILNDYGAVKYYGVTTFTTGIFRAWFGLGDLDSATRLAGILLVFVCALLLLERGQRGRAMYAAAAGAERPLARVQLAGVRAAAAVAVCGVPLLFGFVLPVTQLGYWAVGTAATVIDVQFLGLVRNTFLLAGTSALLCVAIALLVTYATRLNPRAWLRRLARVTVLGYSIPGAVIAVGVLVPFAWLDHRVAGVTERLFGISTGLLLSGTVAALLFAYAVRFMAVAFLPIESGFTRVCGHVDEAARCLGAAPGRTLREVALPLLRGTLVAAAILVFVDVLKELPLTLILRPFNFDTLATRAYQLATDELVAASANYALLIIATGVVPVIVLNRLVSRGLR